MNGGSLGETMSCSEFVELVTDYLEGRMGDEERQRFDAHIEVCPPCLHYLAQMRITLEAVGRIPEESISAEARDELLQAFGDWHAADR